MSEPRPITSAELNQVLDLVQSLRGNVAEQLTIFAHAYVASCKARGVSREEAAQELDNCFDSEHEIITPQIN